MTMISSIAVLVLAFAAQARGDTFSALPQDRMVAFRLLSNDTHVRAQNISARPILVTVVRKGKKLADITPAGAPFPSFRAGGCSKGWYNGFLYGQNLTSCDSRNALLPLLQRPAFGIF